MAKSKFFRVAVAGPTVDGRVIEPRWLTEIAATYNPATYAARVNMEHIRGVTADKPFKAYGDVLAFKAEEIDLDIGGKTEKRMALFAEIAPTDELVAMNRDLQKLYTSIEVQPDFAGTKLAYGVGIAVTDSPASLGTERLTFAVKNPGVTKLQPTPLADGNVFSLGLETRFELAEEPADPDKVTGAITAGFAKLAALFGAKSEPEKPKEEPKPAPANDNDMAAFATAIGEQVATAISTALAPVQASIATVKAEVATVKASIETTDRDPSRRSPSTGGNTGTILTDF